MKSVICYFEEFSWNFLGCTFEEVISADTLTELLCGRASLFPIPLLSRRILPQCVLDTRCIHHRQTACRLGIWPFDELRSSNNALLLSASKLLGTSLNRSPVCTNTTNGIFFSFSGLLHSSPDSLAESWFRAKLSRQQSYSSTYEESDLDLSRSLGIHALIDNMVSFISGDVGLAPAFKEPEESMSTSPQAIILAMEQQQSRAEVSDSSARSPTK